MDTLDLSLSKKEAEQDEKLDTKGSFDWEAFLQKNKLSLILGLVGIFLVSIGVLSAVRLSSKEDQSSIEILSEEEGGEAEIYIHVAGAVQRPGLYKLENNARVNDALIAAGGLSAQADRNWFSQTVNLAQKLQDGLKLYIPFDKEVNPAPGAGIVDGVVAGDQTSIFVSDSQAKININTASQVELESLPRIGPVCAQKIIDYRSQHGQFAKVEEIIKVSGIGDKIFEDIKDKITVF